MAKHDDGKESSTVIDHVDLFRPLSEAKPISYKLSYLHHLLRTDYPFLSRMALAIYEPSSDMLKTYASHDKQHTSLYHYEFCMSDSHSLMELRDKNMNRVINDLSITRDIERIHSQKIAAEFKSSYTMPLFHNGLFLGFAFFNGDRVNCFSELVLPDLDMVGHILSLLLADERNTIHILRTVISTCVALTHSRHPQYGAHIERVSRYSRIIARELAPAYRLSDSYIEHLYWFVPLYDLNQLCIPESILHQSTQKLMPEADKHSSTDEKTDEMLHALIDVFGFGGSGHIDMLRNIVLSHSAYRQNRVPENVAIEARIVAMANLFDGLCLESAADPSVLLAETVDSMTPQHFEYDADCIAVIKKHLNELESVFQRF